MTAYAGSEDHSRFVLHYGTTRVLFLVRDASVACGRGDPWGKKIANHLCLVIFGSWLCSCGIHLPGVLSSFHDSLTRVRGQKRNAERRQWLINTDTKSCRLPFLVKTCHIGSFFPIRDVNMWVGNWAHLFQGLLFWPLRGGKGPEVKAFFRTAFPLPHHLFCFPFFSSKNKSGPSKEGLLGSSAVVGIKQEYVWRCAYSRRKETILWWKWPRVMIRGRAIGVRVRFES